jgi:uncharacterized protein (DUF433 family)
MSIVETKYDHITLDDNSVPIIKGTTLKVVELVAAKHAYGWSPEELHFQHPYLTLGQIYSALAYYSDHQEALDADIARRDELVNEIRSRVKPVPLVERLKQQGLL